MKHMILIITKIDAKIDFITVLEPIIRTKEINLGAT